MFKESEGAENPFKKIEKLKNNEKTNFNIVLVLFSSTTIKPF